MTGRLPTKAKRPVVVQQSSGKRWIKIATGKTTKKGAYQLRTTAPTAPGDYRLRVVAKKGTFKVAAKKRGSQKKATRKRLPALTSKPRSVSVLGLLKPPRPTDTTPPAVPAELVATAGDAQVALAWQSVTAPDRATTAAGPWTRLTDAPVPETTNPATGLSNGTPTGSR